LEETYPAIKTRAAREGTEIPWSDEVGLAVDPTPARGYAPPGEPVILDVPDTHLHVHQISTITNAREVHFTTYPQTRTDALFVEFLAGRCGVRQARCF